MKKKILLTILTVLFCLGARAIPLGNPAMTTNNVVVSFPLMFGTVSNGIVRTNFFFVDTNNTYVFSNGQFSINGVVQGSAATNSLATTNYVNTATNTVVQTNDSRSLNLTSTGNNFTGKINGGYPIAGYTNFNLSSSVFAPQASDAPTTYPFGITLYAALTANGWLLPDNGLVWTMVSSNGYVSQWIYDQGTYDTVLERNGYNGSGWGSWEYPLMSSTTNSIAAVLNGATNGFVTAAITNGLVPYSGTVSNAQNATIAYGVANLIPGNTAQQDLLSYIQSGTPGVSEILDTGIVSTNVATKAYVASQIGLTALTAQNVLTNITDGTITAFPINTNVIIITSVGFTPTPANQPYTNAFDGHYYGTSGNGYYITNTATLTLLFSSANVQLAQIALGTISNTAPQTMTISGGGGGTAPQAFYGVVQNYANGAVTPQNFPAGLIVGTIPNGSANGTSQTNTALAIASVNHTYNILNYGAYGDCQELTNAYMTINSTNLLSFTSPFTPGDVGKNVEVVNGAGLGTNLAAQITSFITTSNVGLSVASSRAVTNFQAYYGHDDTPVINNLVSNIVSVWKINGTVLFPSDHNYFIDGQFQYENSGSVSNYAQIVIPFQDFEGTTNLGSITLAGEIEPNVNFQLNDGQVSTLGAILVSARTPIKGATIANAVANSCMIGYPNPTTSGASGFNFIRVGIKNLTFRTYDNTKTTPLNLSYVQANVYGCCFDGGWPYQIMTQPQYKTYGVVMPALNATPNNTLENCGIVEYCTAFKWSEVSTANNLRGAFCDNIMEITGDTHALHLGYIWFADCPTNIVDWDSIGNPAPSGTLSAAIDIDCWDYEGGGTDVGLPAWMAYQYFIVAPNMLISGHINEHLIEGGTGAKLPLNIVGKPYQNLQCYDMTAVMPQYIYGTNIAAIGGSFLNVGTGSDTVAVGANIQFQNEDGSLSSLLQLNSKGGIDLWNFFTGNSTWEDNYSFNTNGATFNQPFLGTTTFGANTNAQITPGGMTVNVPVTNNAGTTLTGLTNNGLTYLNGNVGIGTAAPSHLLGVNGTVNTRAISVYINAVSNGDYAAIGFQQSPVNTYVGSEIRGINSSGGTDGDLVFALDDASTGALVERMHIKGATGNVGIGTTNPVTALDIGAGVFSGNLSGGTNLPASSLTGTVTNNIGTSGIDSGLTVTTGGITNNLSVNIQVVDFSGTSVTMKTSSGTSYSLGTITTPDTLTLPPGASLTGTSCAGAGIPKF